MHMRNRTLFMLWFSGFILLVFLVMQPLEVYYYSEKIPFLFPDGRVAIRERDLLLIFQVLMCLVVIPVYVLTFFFSWKYHAYNPKAKYDPDLDDSLLAEFIWWGLPCLLILVLSAFTWMGTYQLDPFKPLISDKEPLKIQVVALQWKWLFIYPDEKIAMVNFFQVPENTPINFEITADAPMNSFWIPALGGQIYAMPSMRTKLHLIGEKVGEFRGSSANISGEGFAGMHFIAKVSTEEEYRQWLQSLQSSPGLDLEAYVELAKPSKNNPVVAYQLQKPDLFDHILMKYMYTEEH